MKRIWEYFDLTDSEFESLHDIISNSVKSKAELLDEYSELFEEKKITPREFAGYCFILNKVK